LNDFHGKLKSFKNKKQAGETCSLFCGMISYEQQTLLITLLNEPRFEGKIPKETVLFK